MSPHCRQQLRRPGNCLRSRRAVSSVLVCLALAAAGAGELDRRGSQFIGFSSFSGFAESAGELPGEKTLTSPEMVAAVPWDELVASWNATMAEGAYLKMEARALYRRGATKYYTLGLYSGDPARHPRQSVPHQADADGDVATDTLLLKEPCARLQVRVTLGGDDRQLPALRFLGLCLTDSQAKPPALPPNRAAWGRTIPVPERSQMAYSNGAVLCSPVTVSMIMAYWSRTLNRPELDPDVPDVVKAVYDPVWQGTGNWPFNTAYAGSYPGMRAYVTRFTDLAELEDWTAAGLPVGLSVCLNRLRGRQGPLSGHLVVSVGFTKDGEPVLNDPGTSHNVRKVVSRKNLISAWAQSKNAVYLIYPDNATLPVDRFGHWDSPASPPGLTR